MRKITEMKKIHTFVVALLILATVLACNNGNSGTGNSVDPIVNPGEVCPNPDAHVFWNQYKDTIDLYGITGKSDLEDRLTMYDDYASIIGSLTPLALQDKINHVCSGTSSAATTFYNTYSIWMPASITTGSQLDECYNKSYTKIATVKQFTGTITTLSTTAFDPDYGYTYGFITENKDDISITVINASTRQKVNISSYLVPSTDGFFLETKTTFPVGTYIVVVSGTYRSVNNKTYQAVESFTFVFTK